MGRVLDETQKELEEDVDQEIEDLKKDNENKLSANSTRRLELCQRIEEANLISDYFQV